MKKQIQTDDRTISRRLRDRWRELFSESRVSQMTADELFRAALDRRSMTYRVDEDGLYIVQVGDVSATVNLENVRRNYERDHDPGLIEEFVQQLDADIFGEQPTWEAVCPFLRYSLESSDCATGFEDTLHEVVSPDLVKVFVYTPPDGSRITWVTFGMIADWNVTSDEVVAMANLNMGRLVQTARLEVEDVGGVDLGMLALEDTPFKASLILSPEFKSLVSPVHGWPVFVVAPARDFVFVLSTANRDFLGRLGGVVLREFSESGHPITADVLEVGDHGITAIGSFAPKDEE